MADRLRDRIDAIAAAQLQPRGPRNCVLRVEVPSREFEHAVAVGVARADSDRPARVDDRFHVASVGKTFTAVLAARAAAAGYFGPTGVDSTLGELGLLPSALIAALHPQARDITVRHLLTHTSGFKDMVTDDASGTAEQLGAPAPDSMIARYARSVAACRQGEPDDGFARHRWSPWDAEQPTDPMAGILNLFVASGTAATPVGAPGERYHYSDTAFVLLGVLVELATGRRYHELQREQILEPLGMSGTSMAYRDQASSDARAEEMDIWFGHVALLSEGFDVSFDWGGGGQVSTVRDLIAFLRAVLDPMSGLLDDSCTLTQWCVPQGLTSPRREVGLGLFRWEAGQRVVVGHAGAWGVRVFHDPSTDAWLAGTVNERNDGTWMADVFDAVKEEFR